MTIQPLPCVNGTYSDKRGAVACDICPAGYSCFNVSDPPKECNNGEYSIAGDAACKVLYSIAANYQILLDTSINTRSRLSRTVQTAIFLIII
jgi:hypothetical protein